ncbi:MAG: hypothetical protein WC858_01240 [Parcubacteria group bacterium]
MNTAQRISSIFSVIALVLMSIAFIAYWSCEPSCKKNQELGVISDLDQPNRSLKMSSVTRKYTRVLNNVQNIDYRPFVEKLSNSEIQRKSILLVYETVTDPLFKKSITVLKNVDYYYDRKAR